MPKLLAIINKMKKDQSPQSHHPRPTETGRLKQTDWNTPTETGKLKHADWYKQTDKSRLKHANWNMRTETVRLKRADWNRRTVTCWLKQVDWKWRTETGRLKQPDWNWRSETGGVVKHADWNVRTETGGLKQNEPFCQVRRQETQWLDGVVGAVGIGHFFILLFMASNLGATKSIAPCEATEPGKYVTNKYIFNSKI